MKKYEGSSLKKEKYLNSTQYKSIVVLTCFRRIIDKSLEQISKEMGYLQSKISKVELGNLYVKDEVIYAYAKVISKYLGFDFDSFFFVLYLEASKMNYSEKTVYKDATITCAKIFKTLKSKTANAEK